MDEKPTNKHDVLLIDRTKSGDFCNIVSDEPMAEGDAVLFCQNSVNTGLKMRGFVKEVVDFRPSKGLRKNWQRVKFTEQI